MRGWRGDKRRASRVKGGSAGSGGRQCEGVHRSLHLQTSAKPDADLVRLWRAASPSRRQRPRDVDLVQRLDCSNSSPPRRCLRQPIHPRQQNSASRSGSPARKRQIVSETAVSRLNASKRTAPRRSDVKYSPAAAPRDRNEWLVPGSAGRMLRRTQCRQADRSGRSKPARPRQPWRSPKRDARLLPAWLPINRASGCRSSSCSRRARPRRRLAADDGDAKSAAIGLAITPVQSSVQAFTGAVGRALVGRSWACPRIDAGSPSGFTTSPWCGSAGSLMSRRWSRGRRCQLLDDCTAP